MGRQRPSDRNPIWPRYLVAALLLAGIAIGAYHIRSGKAEPSIHRISGETMGTTYNVTIVDRRDRVGARDAMRRAVIGELDLVNMTMSRYQRDSELYRFNQSRSADPFPMSKTALEVLKKALRLSEESGGAYDVTVTPLVKLWGFSDKRPRAEPPSDAELKAAMDLVGWRKIEVDLDAGTIRKTDPRMTVDLSSIAKGAAVDQIARALDAYKHKDYMIEVGGEVRCKGESPRGTPWRIGIEQPLAGEREIREVIELEDTAMATSGDYRSFYDLSGKRLSHTIDPRTGYPVEHGLASVTVIHKSCAVADGLATALTVLGPEEGFELAVAEQLNVLFITREPDGTLVERATDAFEEMRKSGKASKGN